MIDPQIRTQEDSVYSRSSSTVSDSREWWEPYSPLLILLLLLATGLAYYWPAYPDLTPYFAIWMLLLDVALWFVALRVSNILKLSKYRTVQFKPNGTPVTFQKRRFVGWAIRASATLAVLATVDGLLYGGLNGDYETAGRYLLSYLLIALVFATLFVLVWPGRVSGLERLLDTYAGFWVTFLLFVAVAIGISSFLIFGMPAQLAQGKPARWPTLLQFAQHQADKLSKGAVVESVDAGPPYYNRGPYNAQTTALGVDFVFRRPDGSSARIELLDTDPPRLQSVKDKWDFLGFESGSSLPPDLLPRYEANLRYVQISPRDAYRLTEKEGLDFAHNIAPGQSPDVGISMFLDHDWKSWFGVPAGWNVEYTGTLAGGTYRSLNLRVDGSSGKVLAREHWPEDLQTKATPSVPTATTTPLATPGP